MNSTLVANELIAYQKGSPLFYAMTELIVGFQKQKRFHAKLISNSKMSSLIMKYTGLNVVFDDYNMEDESAFIYIPDINRNNVLFHDLMKDYFENVLFHNIREKNNELDGSVNVATSKVSGVFSKFQTTIGLGNAFWKTKGNHTYTPREVAAIILHELGHLFTTYLYLVETVKTNMVLSALNRSEFFKSDKEKKIKMLNELEEQTDRPIEDKELLAISEKEIVYTVLITDSINKPRSDLNTPTYDERTSEFIADQFATMHGAGADLASGLNKNYTKYNNVYNRRDTFIKISIDYLKTVLTDLAANPFNIIALVSAALLGGVAAMMSVAVIICITIFIARLVIYVVVSEFMPQLYDDPVMRLRKIKEQYTGLLRDRNISKQEKKKILEDIKTVDGYIEFTREYPDIFDFIYKVVIPWSRKRGNVAQLQHDYETLANNPFYTASAQMTV